MERLADAWHWTKIVSGVGLITTLCLYLIRCVSTFSILNLDQFDRFIRLLLRTILT